ncbi:MAG TPA: exodeoxyribonuclease VII small subunit [Candidatus Dormibacteraeota bacterium]|nr:exodeoxyribonuclease VII small subunit [Candidatus Dormibacteraeota bacterium]
MSDDIAAMRYEQALAELDALIGRLEGGTVDLDEAIACYERGSRLAQRCAELLDLTEQRVMQLVVGSGPTAQERPFVGEQAQPAPAPPPGPVTPQRARPASAPRPGGLLPGVVPPSQPARGEPEFDLDDIPF